MVDKIIQFKCPCCHKKLQLDTETKRAQAVKFEAKTDGAELDRLIDDQTKQSQQRGDFFDQAQSAERKRDNEFDDLFSNAIDDAKKHKDDKPNRPFDLD